MWAIQIDKQGGPEVMEWRELPDPKPGAGDLLIEVAAAGLNYIDTYHRSGLYQVTLPYVLQLARKGLERAITESAALRQGVNVYRGRVTNPAVAETFGLECAAL